MSSPLTPTSSARRDDVDRQLQKLRHDHEELHTKMHAQAQEYHGQRVELEQR